ncbi:MAG: S1 RNA-binding domain-containing protein [Dialister invisus]
MLRNGTECGGNGKDTTDLKMTEYMVPFVGEPFDAHITGLTRFGIFVGLDNGVEGLVHIDSMDDDEYVYQEDTMTVKGLRGGKKYTMGMPVRVTLVKADKENGSWISSWGDPITA